MTVARLAGGFGAAIRDLALATILQKLDLPNLISGLEIQIPPQRTVEPISGTFPRIPVTIRSGIVIPCGWGAQDAVVGSQLLTRNKHRPPLSAPRCPGRGPGGPSGLKRTSVRDVRIHSRDRPLLRVT